MRACHASPSLPLPLSPSAALDRRYLTADDWYLICAHFKDNIPKARPVYVQIDGFVHHWDKDALQMLADDKINVFFLKSQDSDSDQLNDNGPNGESTALSLSAPLSLCSSLSAPPLRRCAGSVKAGYGRLHDVWLQMYPGVPFSPFYLNPLLAGAWAEFASAARPIIIRAAARCGIWPFNEEAENFKGNTSMSKIYDLVGASPASPEVVASPVAPQVQRQLASTPQVVLQLKAAAAAEPGTQVCVVRAAAEEFFEKSFVVPAQRLQNELKKQRELKQKTCKLGVDRLVPPNTSVGRWVTSGVLNQLEDTSSSKVRCRPLNRQPTPPHLTPLCPLAGYQEGCRPGDQGEDDQQAGPQARRAADGGRGRARDAAVGPRRQAQGAAAHGPDHHAGRQAQRQGGGAA